jgi:hypothetical protein
LVASKRSSLKILYDQKGEGATEALLCTTLYSRILLYAVLRYGP